MKKKVFGLLLSGSLCFSTALHADAKPGTAAKQGASASTIAWAAIGITFLVAIGVAVAITISND